MGSGTHGASANGCRQLLPVPVEALVTCGIPKDIVLSVYDRLVSAQAPYSPSRRSSESIDDATHGSSYDAIHSGNDVSQDPSRGSLSDVSQRVSDATGSPSHDLPPCNIYTGSDATNGGSCDSINRNITATMLFLAVEAAWRSEWRGHWQDHQLVLSPVNDHQENIVGHWNLGDLQDDGEKNNEHTSSDSVSVQQQQTAAGDHSAEIADPGVSATTSVDISEENTTTSSETRTAVAEPTEGSISTSDLTHTPAISPASVENPTAMGHVPSPSSAPTEDVMDITDEKNLVRTESHQTVSSLTTSIPATEGVPTPTDQPQTSTSLLLSPRRDVHEFPPEIHSAAAVTATNSASMPTSTPTTEPQSPTTTTERERNPSINKSGERRRKLERLRALRSENKRLKARQMCRHCHVRPVSLTLLPCGHFCFCQECGSTFTACPVCRKTILADVRTFVS
ncbi:serine-rich adhesin for platelets-like isoform X2 [Littorina saxatilis]|uniref:RING-type domain-containing protein n=2 Tax=Littorina saxatilis TaxID=31220 RepID=A0AAN9G0U8_9CAEN